MSITIRVLFPDPPVGVQTDSLVDTFCYRQAVDSIEAAVQGRSFNLIEHLAGCLYDVAFLELKGKQGDLKVTVKKMAPPVPGIHGGVSFHYSGQPHQKGTALCW